jgi:hypothetical protein
MQHHQHDLVKMSHLSEKEQQFCSSRIDKPHKFSYETDNWWFDAGGLPICQYCGVIDDRDVKPDSRATKGRRRKMTS